jgi:hypothetical protein
MMLTVSTTDRRDGKALALFARCDDWQAGKTRDGRSFFAIPGSERGLFHMADQNDCSCPDRRQRREVCKHMRAVRFWMAAFKTGTVAPKRAASASNQDDRIALTPLGAQYLADLAATSEESSIEHPQVTELRGMLARETCQEDRQAIAAKLHDTQAKIASVAASKRTGYSSLMDRHLVEA